MDPVAMTVALIQLLALVFSTLAGLSGAQYRLENLTLSIERAVVGDTLTATCDINNERGKRILMYWIRQTPNKHTVELSVNYGLSDHFDNTGRYSVGVKLNNRIRDLQYQLNITDLRTEDSGTLGCRLIGDEGERFENFRDFSVTVPVQKVEWILSEPNSTNLALKYEGFSSIDNLHEGQARRFVCRVNGSYPQPLVKIRLDGEDITSRFSHNPRLVMGSGVVGLQPVYYEVELSNDALVLDYSYHEKILRCEASLLRSDIPAFLNSTLVHKHADLNITLQYKPKFLCNNEMYVNMNEPNYRLVCKVHANPEVLRTRITFIDPDDTNQTLDVLEDGMSSGDYKANVTSGATDQEIVIVLTINRVYKQHFRKYTFEATSGLGTVSHDVMLKESRGQHLPVNCANQMKNGIALATVAVAFLLHFGVYV